MGRFTSWKAGWCVARHDEEQDKQRGQIGTGGNDEDGWDEYQRRARLLASLEALLETEEPIALIGAGRLGSQSPTPEHFIDSPGKHTVLPSSSLKAAFLDFPADADVWMDSDPGDGASNTRD